MTLDILVGGMPRGGTTVAAKFASLHPDTFCYAGETHLIPYMHSMFGYLPCRAENIGLVTKYLRQHFMTTMVDAPRYNVDRGAHPKNLIFNESNVEDLVESVRDHLRFGLYGADLHKASLKTLKELLSSADHRSILGEKTPSNVFAMAKYAELLETKNIVVIREPIGVLRSMNARVEGGDAYSGVFKGGLEYSIGMYLEYAMAVAELIGAKAEVLLVRYEDIAERPKNVIQDLFKLSGGVPDERVIQFVEQGGDPEVAGRAPMHYRRLHMTTDIGNLSPMDVWKVFSLTSKIRERVGYSDAAMLEYGFDLPLEWPGLEIPTTILPLYGFHETGLFNGPVMKKKGGVLVYLGKARTQEVTLCLKSEFPVEVADTELDLSVSVNGVCHDILKIKSGPQTTIVNVLLRSDDITTMGKSGGYGVIDLDSSITHSQFGYIAGVGDVHNISFQLTSWKINNVKSRWWWRDKVKKYVSPKAVASR